MKFSNLGLVAPILKALEGMGYVAPSPIQEKAIPPALEGRDVLGCAQTGTGKTCAFATPILQRLAATQVKGRPIRALVLTPTRELALQIQESFTAYGKGLPLRSAVIFGGVGQGPQVERLKRGVDILVATPGRLLDLQGQGLLDLSRLEIFVLDEADRMLDMGFIHDVRRILKLLPQQKQTLFFSATMPPEVVGLVDALLKDPIKVAVDPVSSPVEVIDQKVYLVDKGNKTKLLASLIAGPQVKNVLVFTRTKHGANKVAGDLGKAGIAAAAIHGNKSQTARQQALADFKAGKVKVLVATDIAARGLDIEELSHVVNYNLPEVPETYVHRIGRTGRAGHGGTAISFCDFGEKGYLKEIQKLLGRAIPVVEGHPWPMEVFEAPAKDAKGRPVNADDQEARQAARERKRAKEAERRAAQKAEEAQPAKPEQAAPIPQEPPRRKRGVRRNRLEETLPAQPTEGAVRTEFRRPDPLASERIMDATARLLAPRPRPAFAAGHEAPEKGAGPKSRPSRTKRSPAQGEKSAQPERPGQGGAKKRGKRPEADRRGSRRGPQPTELRLGNQKDSTEQPSLMKPYYLGQDD
jgi:ATP-dependent RNA helicase RhlE